MRNTKLSLTQVCNNIDYIYSSAKLNKYNANWVIAEFKKLIEELNSTSPSGARRYPVFMAQYAKGYDMALHNQLWRNELEFCYVMAGNIYSTHKDSCHDKAELLYDKCSSYLMDSLERGHYWKNSSVKFA
jgi:CMP-N-acetylneuraminic acid synthetase